MHKQTLLTTLGTSPEKHSGAVNTPVYRASTILFPTLADFDAAERGEYPHPTYGRNGTPTSASLEEALNGIEEADYTALLSSGMAAIACALLAFLKSGDHLLMTDSVYGPARRFCDYDLKRMGVETTYYDPTIGAGIANLIKDNTSVVYVESPGSLTFEVQDIPAIAKAAHAKGDITVIGDNTWATPLYMNAFELGMDVSIHSGTKYISGHSDLMLGVVSARKSHSRPLNLTWHNMGACAAPDNIYLALRGLRTMAVRLKQHYEHGLLIADWLQSLPCVRQVLHPALPGAPGHELWRRDFSGACGLFSIVVNPCSREALAAMLDSMELFGMGYSWGGFESLIMPVNLQKVRTATQPQFDGQILRLHIGLEHPEDLMRDLEHGFERMRRAC